MRNWALARRVHWDLAMARVGFGQIGLLLLALLACGVSHTQVVVRYEMDLANASPEATQCWDHCLGRSNDALQRRCLQECPGVTVAWGEGCQHDGRHTRHTMCHTSVKVLSGPDESTVNLATSAGGALTVGAIRGLEEGLQEGLKSRGEARRSRRRQHATEAENQPAETRPAERRPPNPRDRPHQPNRRREQPERTPASPSH